MYKTLLIIIHITYLQRVRTCTIYMYTCTYMYNYAAVSCPFSNSREWYCTVYLLLVLILLLLLLVLHLLKVLQRLFRVDSRERAEDRVKELSVLHQLIHAFIIILFILHTFNKWLIIVRMCEMERGIDLRRLTNCDVHVIKPQIKSLHDCVYNQFGFFI